MARRVQVESAVVRRSAAQGQALESERGVDHVPSVSRASPALLARTVRELLAETGS